MKRPLLLFLVMLTMPAFVPAQQATPELSITANGGQNFGLYSGWPLIVHATIMNSQRFNNTGNVLPLVIAPNGGAWTRAVQFTVVSRKEQLFQWPLKLIWRPADAAIPLQIRGHIRPTFLCKGRDVPDSAPAT